MEQGVSNLLFENIKKGDKAAFERLFRSMYKPLVNYAYKLIKDSLIAEELSQEVFLYLWDKRDKILINSSVNSYLYSAIRNKCINYIKLELPKRKSEMDISAVEISESWRGRSEQEQERLKKWIDSAIDELPDKCKEAFILSRYSGLTYDEIAEEMELSKKTVENQIGIALKKLRVSLLPLIEEMKKGYI